MDDKIPGVEAIITPGLWRRITIYGIPGQWFAVWMCGGLIQTFICLGNFGIRGIVWAAIIVGVQFLLLRWLTLCDMQWDELRLMNSLKRYRTYYDA